MRVLLRDGPGEWGWASASAHGVDSTSGEVRSQDLPPSVHASETSRTYVVLSWDPRTRGKEPLMYFIEKVCAGGFQEQRVCGLPGH